MKFWVLALVFILPVMGFAKLHSRHIQKLDQTCRAQKGISELAHIKVNKYCQCWSANMGIKLKGDQYKTIMKLYTGKTKEDVYTYSEDHVYLYDLRIAEQCVEHATYDVRKDKGFDAYVKHGHDHSKESGHDHH